MFVTRSMAIACVALPLLACEKDTAGPATGSADTQATVTLSFATRLPSGASLSLSPMFSTSGTLGEDTLVSGTDTLIITQAEIVLREIELERVEVSDCDDEPEPPECEDFETGPVLLDLPLGQGAEQLVTIDVEPGTYDEVEFDIHKVGGDDPADSAFVADHPDFEDTSVRVQGTFNGEEFVYESDLNVEQELGLAPNLVIDENTTSTDVTIHVDLATWFRSSSGGLVDPATANKGGDNENLVEDNIKNSMEAFGDEEGEDDEEDEGIIEFEARVSGVDITDGTFTLANGTVVRVTDETVINQDGDALTLEELKEAVESGDDVVVRAEGDATVEAVGPPPTLVGLEVKFEVDD